jgi:hypothetical protein
VLRYAPFLTLPATRLRLLSKHEALDRPFFPFSPVFLCSLFITRISFDNYDSTHEGIDERHSQRLASLRVQVALKSLVRAMTDG